LQEATAVLILAWQAAGREHERSRNLSFANPWTAGMAGGHDVMASGLMAGHFGRWRHVPSSHEEHWRQGHLCPGHHDHQQQRRNRLLRHPALVWQIDRRHDVTKITLIITLKWGPDQQWRLCHQIFQRRP
jgi:hypothetical protein